MPEDKTAEIPLGVAMNIASSAEALLCDAVAVVDEPHDGNRRDLIASMRIMVHRIYKAFDDIGVKFDV